MANKLTQDEFIRKAELIHNNKYDYSLAEYKNSITKIKILCHVHGEFIQPPGTHLAGVGCPRCAGKNKTTEDFIIQAKKIHGDKYDYSLVKYKKTKTKVQIICPIHGIFEQTPICHLKSNGCQKCASNYKKDNAWFINKAITIHADKYFYNKVDYKNNYTKIIITCKKHGDFLQEPSSHLKGMGCYKCAKTEIGIKQRKTTENIIKKFKNTHGELYDYSLVDYSTAKNKVCIMCKTHGEFKQNAFTHIKGSGCPKCSNSKGEKFISNILKINKINFSQQYKFKECKHTNELPFDFFLNNYNCCLEFHGRQHFYEVDYFKGTIGFSLQQKRDQLKENYCSLNNISLIIIFKKHHQDEKTFFVDLFKNASENIKEIFLKSNLIQYSTEEYYNYKKEMLTRHL